MFNKKYYYADWSQVSIEKIKTLLVGRKFQLKKIDSANKLLIAIRSL
jgi:hypothetical protein